MIQKIGSQGDSELQEPGLLSVLQLGPLLDSAPVWIEKGLGTER